MRRFALRAAVALVVAGSVLLGIWVTGGAITNDFGVAMWLTAAWMALAGLACLVVALRVRAVRWPVLAAYAVTAGAAGAYLGSSTLLDDTVDEEVAVAAPAPRAASGRQAPEGGADAAPRRNVLLRAGALESVRHPARGMARLIRLADGGRVLTLTGFEVDNGPDLRLYLVAGAARDEGEVRDVIDLGALKGNRGDQQYRIPPGADVRRHGTVVVWCRAFSVLFARAPLAAPP